jgi:hypothetical protein
MKACGRFWSLAALKTAAAITAFFTALVAAVVAVVVAVEYLGIATTKPRS